MNSTDANLTLESILPKGDLVPLELKNVNFSEGRQSYEWARLHMPSFVLAESYVKKKIERNNPFRGMYLAACLHVSKETAVLINSLHSFGMKIRLVAANPLSSQNEIATFLESEGIDVRASKGESVKEYKSEISSAAKSDPDFIMDDGGELHVAYAQSNRRSCVGGTDETTSGTIRLRALDAQEKLRYPVIAVNDSPIKHIFDNRYGSGQSAIDGLVRATGLLLAGKIVVVLGFGWVGRGVAERARGLGARVVVTEVNPSKALEAMFEGFQVLEMIEASKIGDIFLTCTGQIHAISTKHFKQMKHGAILANVGHFDQEINVKVLRELGRAKQVRNNVEKIEFRSSGISRQIFLLCQGRVVNLVSAEGHPPEVMQLSFANQLLSIHYLVANRRKLEGRKEKIIPFPEEIDYLVGQFALQGFGLKIDKLTNEQIKYGASFERM